MEKISNETTVKTTEHGKEDGSKKNIKDKFNLKLKNIKHLEIILAVIVCVIIVVAFVLYSSKSNSSSANSAASTNVESRLENILSKINGVGNVKVMIYYENSLNNSESNSINFTNGFSSSSKSQEIKGVIVVAEGASDMNVKVQLLRAVETILSINADCIEIFTMK